MKAVPTWHNNVGGGNMRKITVILTLVILFMLTGTAYAQGPDITAASAILMEMESGKILYKKDIFKPMPPASTTKVLTAILALDITNPSDEVEISKNSASTGEASIYLDAGEKLTVEELLKGALIKSGNDAAVALAEHVAGNVELFSLLMNKKSRLLGGTVSNFVNPNGLPDDRHVSSTFDLATITRYALKDALFKQIVDTKLETIPWNGSGQRYLRNTNRLLWEYSYVNGVKTGTTRAAGQCLVASAYKDGMQLISVVFKSKDRYGDTLKLLNYGFANYKVEYVPKGQVLGKIHVANGTKNYTWAETKRPLVFVYNSNYKGVLEKKLDLTRSFSAPVELGKEVGTLSLWLANEKMAAVPLVTSGMIGKKKNP